MGGNSRYQLPREVPIANLRTDSRVHEGWDILREQRYGDFDVFLRSAQSGLSRDDLGVLCFIRGVLKTFLCDPTILEDFQNAERFLSEPIQFTPNSIQCLGSDPTLLRRIRPKTSSLFKFRNSVEKAGPVLDRLTRNPLRRMICSVIVAETFYLNGKIPQAISLAAPVFSFANENEHPLLLCYAGFVLIRCAIVTGDAVWFRHLLDTISRATKSAPMLQEMSGRIAGWLNAATGYLGVAPRYTVLPSGIEIPNIDARVAYRMDMGMGDQIAIMPNPISADENLPIALADVYTHLFHAMMFYKHREPEEAVRRFAMADAITRENRIYMPFAEYGDQIVPLLRYAMKKDAISRLHMNKLLTLAQTYEKGLRAIREDVADYEQTGILAGLLTKSEQAVLRLMCEGRNNEEIAATLGNRPNTVSELARRVFRKMRVENRKEAVDRAIHKKYFS